MCKATLIGMEEFVNNLELLCCYVIYGYIMMLWNEVHVPRPLQPPGSAWPITPSEGISRSLLVADQV